MAALEGLLSNEAPTLTAPLQDVQRVAERIAGDPSILTVEHVSRVFGIGPRSLQRLFRTYVGAGPKWMIRLYRIKEAAARIEEGNVVNWQIWPVSSDTQISRTSSTTSGGWSGDRRESPGGRGHDG